MSQYKFHYFDAYGRGEQVRICLSYLGIKYTDNRIKMQ